MAVPGGSVPHPVAIGSARGVLVRRCRAATPPPAAINAACFTSHIGLPLPLLLVCEDNGLGISTPTTRVDRGLARPPTRPALRARRRYRSGGGLATTSTLADPVRSPASRGSCTSAPCASWATPAPTSSRVIVGHGGPPDHRRDPILGTAQALVATACRHPTIWSIATSRFGRRLAVDLAMIHAPTFDMRTTGDIAVAPPPGPGGGVDRIPARPRPARAPSTLHCPSTRPVDARPIDHPRAGRILARHARRPRVRRGRRRQGRRVRRDPRPAEAVRRGRVFDTLLDEQSILGLGPRRRAVGAGADPGDPVPRLPAQRRGPVARRGRQPVVLLQRAVPQPDSSCGSPATATRRASAGTSTTTTRSPCCATSPAS